MNLFSSYLNILIAFIMILDRESSFLNGGKNKSTLCGSCFLSQVQNQFHFLAFFIVKVKMPMKHEWTFIYNIHIYVYIHIYNLYINIHLYILGIHIDTYIHTDTHI
jgi:hypothetical protein